MFFLIFFAFISASLFNNQGSSHDEVYYCVLNSLCKIKIPRDKLTDFCCNLNTPVARYKKKNPIKAVSFAVDDSYFIIDFGFWSIYNVVDGNYTIVLDERLAKPFTNYYLCYRGIAYRAFDEFLGHTWFLNFYAFNLMKDEKIFVRDEREMNAYNTTMMKKSHYTEYYAILKIEILHFATELLIYSCSNLVNGTCFSYNELIGRIAFSGPSYQNEVELFRDYNKKIFIETHLNIGLYGKLMLVQPFVNSTEDVFINYGVSYSKGRKLYYYKLPETKIAYKKKLDVRYCYTRVDMPYFCARRDDFFYHLGILKFSDSSFITPTYCKNDILCVVKTKIMYYADISITLTVTKGCTFNDFLLTSPMITKGYFEKGQMIFKIKSLRINDSGANVCVCHPNKRCTSSSDFYLSKGKIMIETYSLTKTKQCNIFSSCWLTVIHRKKPSDEQNKRLDLELHKDSCYTSIISTFTLDLRFYPEIQETDTKYIIKFDLFEKNVFPEDIYIICLADSYISTVKVTGLLSTLESLTMIAGKTLNFYISGDSISDKSKLSVFPSDKGFICGKSVDYVNQYPYNEFSNIVKVDSTKFQKDKKKIMYSVKAIANSVLMDLESDLLSICCCINKNANNSHCDDLANFIFLIGKIKIRACSILQKTLYYRSDMFSNFHVTGINLSKEDRIALVQDDLSNSTSCTANGLKFQKFDFNKNLGFPYYINEEKTITIFKYLYTTSTKYSYKVCWCSGKACTKSSDFNTFFAKIVFLAHVEFINEDYLPSSAFRINIRGNVAKYDEIRIVHSDISCKFQNTVMDSRVVAANNPNKNDVDSLGWLKSLNPFSWISMDMQINATLSKANSLSFRICYFSTGFIVQDVFEYMDELFLLDIGVINIKGPFIDKTKFTKISSDIYKIELVGIGFSNFDQLKIVKFSNEDSLSHSNNCIKNGIGYYFPFFVSNDKAIQSYNSVVMQRGSSYIVCWLGETNPKREFSFIAKFSVPGLEALHSIHILNLLNPEVRLFGEGLRNDSMYVLNIKMYRTKSIKKQLSFVSQDGRIAFFKNLTFENSGYLFNVTDSEEHVLSLGNIFFYHVFFATSKELMRSESLIQFPCAFDNLKSFLFPDLYGLWKVEKRYVQKSLFLVNIDESMEKSYWSAHDLKLQNVLACSTDSSRNVSAVLGSNSVTFFYGERIEVYRTLFTALELPMDLAVIDGLVFISDFGSKRVLVFNWWTSKVINSYYRWDEAFLSSPAGIEIMKISHSKDTCVDCILCVADIGNHVVFWVRFKYSYNEKLYFSFENDKGYYGKLNVRHSSVTTFDSPFSLASFYSTYDENHILFVAELVNNRVVILKFYKKAYFIFHKIVLLRDSGVNTGIMVMENYLLFTKVKLSKKEGAFTTYFSSYNINYFFVFKFFYPSIPPSLFLTGYKVTFKVKTKETANNLIFVESDHKKCQKLAAVGLQLNRETGTISGIINRTGKFCFAIEAFNLLESSVLIIKLHLVCPVGKEIINGICTKCPVGSYRYHENTCQKCEAFKKFTSTLHTGSLYKNQCLCIPGYQPVEDECKKCPPGTYKSDVSKSLCVNKCFQFSESKVIGATTLEELNCKCIPGYYKVIDENNVTSCEVCEKNYYCVGGDEKPSKCKKGLSTSATGATSMNQCMCNVGYELSPQKTCTPCKIMYYKETISNHSCIMCSQASTENLNRSRIITNSPLDKITFTKGKGSTRKEDCMVCASGFYFNTNSKVCEVCPLSNYCNGNITSCPLYTVTALEGAESITDCLCTVGYGNSNYALSYESNPIKCTKCPLNTFQHLDAVDTPCIPCPAHSKTVEIRGSTLDNCLVESGYYKANNFDVSLHFRDIENSTKREESTFDCGDGDVSGLVGELEYKIYRGSVSECENYCKYNIYCSAYTFYYNETSKIIRFNYINEAQLLKKYLCKVILFDKPKTTNYTFTQSVNKRSCVVSRPKELMIWQNIYLDICPKDSYCSFSRFGNYIKCFPNSSTLKRGSVSVSDCLCNPGHFLSTSNRRKTRFCELCPIGYYKNTTSNEPCNICPERFTTVSNGADSIFYCTCKPGFYYVRNTRKALSDTTVAPNLAGIVKSEGEEDFHAFGECLSCPQNMYCEGFWMDKNNTTHTPPKYCPYGSAILKTTTNAVSIKMCLCIQGFGLSFLDSRNQACSPCPSGFYKENMDHLPCGERCMQFAQTLIGAISKKQCFCNSGRFMAKRSEMESQRSNSSVDDFGCYECLNGAICPGGLHNHIMQRIKQEKYLDIVIEDHILPYSSKGFFTVRKSLNSLDPWKPVNSIADFNPSKLFSFLHVSNTHFSKHKDVKDYFQRYERVPDIHPCPIKEACLGTEKNLCIVGNTGYLCDSCSPGHDKTYFRGLCEKCDSPGISFVISLLKKLLIFLITAISVYFHHKSVRNQTVTQGAILRIWLNFCFYMIINGMLQMSTTSSLKNFANMYNFFFLYPFFYLFGSNKFCLFRSEDSFFFGNYKTVWYFQKFLRLLDPFFTCLFYSCLCLIIKVLYKLIYKDKIKNVYDAIHENRERYTQQQWKLYILPLYSHKFFGMFSYIDPPDSSLQFKIKRFFYDMIPSYVVIFFIFYFFQCISFIELIWCTNVQYKNEPKLNVLFSFHSQLCNFKDPVFTIGFLFGISGIIFWCIGIPLTFFIFETFYNVKYSIQPKIYYGFLDSGYLHKTRAWETFNFFRKFALSFLMVAQLYTDPIGVSEYYRSSMNLIITVISLSLQIGMAPCDKRSHDLLNNLEYYSVLICCFTATVIQGSFHYDFYYLGLLPIILYIAFHCYILWMLIIESGRVCIMSGICSSASKAYRNMPSPWKWYTKIVVSMAVMYDAKKSNIYYDHTTKEFVLKGVSLSNIIYLKKILFKTMSEPTEKSKFSNREYLVTTVIESMSQLIMTHCQFSLPADWLDFIVRYSFCFHYWHRNMKYNNYLDEIHMINLPWNGYIELEAPSIFFKYMTIKSNYNENEDDSLKDVENQDTELTHCFTTESKSSTLSSNELDYFINLESDSNFLEMMFSNEIYDGHTITIMEFYVAVLSMMMFPKEKLVHLHSLYRNIKKRMENNTIDSLKKKNADLEIELKELDERINESIVESNEELSYSMLDYFMSFDKIKEVKKEIKNLQAELKKLKEKRCNENAAKIIEETLCSDLHEFNSENEDFMEILEDIQEKNEIKAKKKKEEFPNLKPAKNIPTFKMRFSNAETSCKRRRTIKPIDSKLKRRTIRLAPKEQDVLQSEMKKHNKNTKNYPNLKVPPNKQLRRVSISSSVVNNGKSVDSQAELSSKNRENYKNDADRVSISSNTLRPPTKSSSSTSNNESTSISRIIVDPKMFLIQKVMETGRKSNTETFFFNQKRNE